MKWNRLWCDTVESMNIQDGSGLLLCLRTCWACSALLKWLRCMWYGLVRWSFISGWCTRLVTVHLKFTPDITHWVCGLRSHNFARTSSQAAPLMRCINIHEKLYFQFKFEGSSLSVLSKKPPRLLQFDFWSVKKTHNIWLLSTPVGFPKMTRPPNGSSP